MGNLSPRDSVNAVLDASAKSARLYGHGLGMIASENIISPNVKRAIILIFTGDMQKVCPVRGTIKAG